MAATSYFGSELSPELAVEAQRIARNEALANAMLQRGAQPLQGRQAGHMYVAPSPMEGVAQLAHAYFGRKQLQQNVSDEQRLAGNYNNMMSEGVQDYMRARHGTGVTPDPQEFSQSEDYGTPRPAPAQGNPREAMIAAMTSKNPFVRSLGGADYAEMRQNEKPMVVPADATLTDTDPNTGRRRVAIEGLAKSAIPDNWRDSLPAGFTTRPGDTAGLIRLKGGDGGEDVYQMEFEGGHFKGVRRVDNALDPNRSGVGRGVPVTIQDPADPTGTIVIDSVTKQVLGKGPKASQSGLNKSEAYGTLQSVNTNLDKLEKQTQLVLDSQLGKITGVSGKIPNWPGGEGSVAKARLEGLKSMIKLDTLQALRNAAHNGSSGLGQVTEKEHEILGQYLGNLDQATNEDEIRRVVADIQAWVKKARVNYQTAYDTKVGATTPPGVPPGTQPAVAPKGGGAGKTPPPPPGYTPL